MSEDKKKAKKEILGELESIKTLLEDSVKEDGDLEDAPLLTEAIDQVDRNPHDDTGYSNQDLTAGDDFDFDEDLTEAPLIDPPRRKPKRTSASTSEDFETEDIESLYADIYRSLKSQTDAGDDGEGDEENNEDSSLVDLEFQNIPILDTVIGDQASAQQQPAAEAVEKSEPETPWQDKFDEEEFDEDDTAELLEAETEHSPARESNSENEEAAKAERVEAPSLFDLEDSADTTAQDAVDEQASGADELTDDTDVADTSTESDEAALNPSEPVEPEPEPHAESQHSLFPETDKATAAIGPGSEPESDPGGRAKSDSEVIKAHQLATQRAVELSKKTENPFLPKHIRDRLHANRVVPNSFTTIGQSSHSQSSDSQGLQNRNVQHRDEHNDFQQHTSQQNSVDTPTDRHQPSLNKSQQERLVDDLVASYLPKIEAELRRKLLELVKNTLKDKT